MADDNFTAGDAAGRLRRSEARGTVGAASWRLTKRPLMLAILAPRGSLIYPPLQGELPGYVVDIDECEREDFYRWIKTLTPEDQARVEAALQLNAEGVPLRTISRRLNKPTPEGRHAPH